MLCVVEDTSASRTYADRLGELRTFRDEVLMSSAAGRRCIAALDGNTLEILTALARDLKLRGQVQELLERLTPVVLVVGRSTTTWSRLPAPWSRAWARRQSRQRIHLKDVAEDPGMFSGRTVRETLTAQDAGGPPGGAPTSPTPAEGTPTQGPPAGPQPPGNRRHRTRHSGFVDEDVQRCVDATASRLAGARADARRADDAGHRREAPA